MLSHKGTQTIHTERLTLRRFAVSDAESMLRNFAGDERVTKFLSWKPYTCVEDVASNLRETAATYTQDDVYCWSITLENEVIGRISVISISEKNHNCELGFCLGSSYWNKGIMTESVCAVIRYLFEEVGMHRIMAKHDVDNPGSGGVMKKCGMTYEGKLRDHYLRKDGTWSDSLVYGILKSEFMA